MNFLKRRDVKERVIGAKDDVQTKARPFSRTLSMDLNTITSHFEALLEDGLIEETAQEKVTSPKYRLTHLGRKYAVENLSE